MTRKKLLAHCLALPGAWVDQPWEGDVVVKVGSKIFAFLGGEKNLSVGIKCGPSRDVADGWLARFPDDAAVMPYIGRSGWNTLRFGGAIPDEELIEAIDASYDDGCGEVAQEGAPSRPIVGPARRPREPCPPANTAIHAHAAQ